MPGSSAADRVAHIHLGLPKSGSTAFQSSLDDASADLLGLGVRILRYDGSVPYSDPTSRALNLAAAVVRADLDAWFRLLTPETALSSFVRECGESVVRQARSDAPALIGSMEDLCLIRTPQEVSTLREILAPRRVHAIVVLRERDTYRTTLRRQVARAGIRTFSPVPDSCLNLAPDSWIFDHDSLIDLLREGLGAESVSVIDYDDAVRTEGSVVPALWRACALPTSMLARLGWDRRWSNVSTVRTEDALETVSDIEVVRDLALRLQEENDRIMLSRAWRYSRWVGRLGRAIAPPG